MRNIRITSIRIREPTVLPVPCCTKYQIKNIVHTLLILKCLLFMRIYFILGDLPFLRYRNTVIGGSDILTFLQEKVGF